MMHFNLKIPYFWCKRNLISWLLYPFSLIYAVSILIRRYYYKLHPAKILKIPLIVVGNITVGGTGKTPLVIYLVKLLQKQGYKIGVISRGYRSNLPRNEVKLVTESTLPAEVGDEPYLIFQQTRAICVVGRKRYDAAKYAAECGCDLLISDDGLQHYAMPRDFEIVVVDGIFKLGNGWLLPAGPLRESKKCLNNVDLIVENYHGSATPLKLPHLKMKIIPRKLYNLVTSEELSAENLRSFKLHFVAGIGNPGKFWETLSNFGLEGICHPFPDHYHFVREDFAFAKADELIILTEKDAVKCQAFADKRFWFLEVSAELDQDLLKILKRKLKLK